MDARDFAKEVADLVPGGLGVWMGLAAVGLPKHWLLYDTLCYFNGEIPRI